MDSNELQDTWSGAIKNQVLWFIFAIMLALGTSYMHVQISVSTIQSDLASIKDRIRSLEENQKENGSKIERVRIDIEILSEKMDILLEESRFKANTQERTGESN